MSDTPGPRRSPHPPDRAPDPLLRMRWEDLLFIHWDVEPEEIARLLPDGLEPDVIEGRGWVGLIPFRMASIRLALPGAGSLPLPWSTFPETNVRTYVRGPDGGRGVYFHSLDVPFTAPTAVARLGFRLPYCTSTMRIGRKDTRLAYAAHRRWPRPDRSSSVRSRVVAEVGEPIPEERMGPLDVALHAQWALYTDRPNGGLLRVDVHHPAWTLREARLHVLQDDLVETAGYRLGGRAPTQVRAADGLEVLVGAPHRPHGEADRPEPQR